MRSGREIATSSGGEIDSGKRRYLLRTVGRFDSVEALENLIIDRRGDSLIRLGDVAIAELDHADIRNYAYLNRPACARCLCQSGAGLECHRHQVRHARGSGTRQSGCPASQRYAHAVDRRRRGAMSRHRSGNVWINLGLGATFAIGVMFLFLRSVRATAIGAIGIPLCTIAAFLGLLAAGRTINVISLAGVAFAIGMTLDNSIVVIESIELKRRQGLDRFRAAVEGVQERLDCGAWPSTMTTILSVPATAVH